MPATVESILNAVNTEWDYWGNSTWDLVRNQLDIRRHDKDRAYAQYVIDKYCKRVKNRPSVIGIQRDDYAWSAAGMSYFMGEAGYTEDEFPFSSLHSHFIRAFVEARNARSTSSAYWAYKLGEAEALPAVGDLVAYVREPVTTPEQALRYFDLKHDYKSHTDVVVAVRAGEIDVIGANVENSVTKKTLPLNESGQIIDRCHWWFAVMKRL